MRKIITISFALLMFVSAAFSVFAAIVPYDSYNYDYWENMVFTPAPYIPGRSISGLSLGIEPFLRPMDITQAPDGTVYVADTGNNRIVVLNENMTEAINIIDGFQNFDGVLDTFNEPSGVTVSADNLLYISDTMNGRIVILDGENRDKLVQIISDPQSEMLDDGYVFMPQKLAVDFAGRVYVVARNMFQGIMVFNSEGDFTVFFGTINVQITPWQIFWRAISTQAERARQALFIPTEFTGIDVDPGGFIYASNIDPEGVQAVRRLNPSGEDVIRTGENKNLGGDLSTAIFNEYSGTSVIVDVVYRDKGIYSLLDSRRGRIFTYDHEGNLLYIFGGLGSQRGTLRQPSAIERIGDLLVVLDSNRNEIITFEATLYGRLINEAVSLRFDGDETRAVEKWRQVLLLNENFELANVGIGKAYLTSGDNINAMKYLELGKNRTFYSIAYKRHRNQVLKENLPYALTAVVLLPVIYITVKKIKNRRKAGKDGANEGVF